MKIKSAKELKLLHREDHFINEFSTGSSIPCSETTTVVEDYSQPFRENIKFSDESFQTKFDRSLTSLCTIRSKRRSVSFSDKVDYVSKYYSHFSHHRKRSDIPKSIFNKKETAVYMTLFDEFCRHRTSGTQATASVNKCFQASHSNSSSYNTTCCFDQNASNSSTLNSSTLPYDSRRQSMQDNRVRYSDIYYFGKKNNNSKGMGSKKTAQAGVSASAPKELVRSSAASVQANTSNNSVAAQTKKVSAVPNNGKTVSIKEKPCPGTIGVTKGDMFATVSHIRIGPREPCPVHGKEPCQGPKCMVAASGQDDQVPVKVSTIAATRLVGPLDAVKSLVRGLVVLHADRRAGHHAGSHVGNRAGSHACCHVGHHAACHAELHVEHLAGGLANHHANHLANLPARRLAQYLAKRHAQYRAKRFV
ncbi:hypothetical protein HF086_017947 [Spodoptera exigua]|uniref:Uncharacterized protein n=1 Tax=Spodoptera exigua TaxID=7107 RepID=A0A922M0A5_SPOEX|nr:hypothetical protein HF086_017947 [Spodoptera exigua]